MERRPTSILTTLAVSVLALTLIAPWVLGQDPDQITEIRRRAEQGDAEAQYVLGYRYATGIGVPRDAAEATRWLRLAAGQGHTQADDFLGRLFPEVSRAPQDDNQSETPPREALPSVTEQGDTEVRIRALELELMFQAMSGDPTALETLQQLADQGDTVAQVSLGNLYANVQGVFEGVRKDEAEAVRWYRMAAEQAETLRQLADQGDAVAQVSLGNLYANVQGVFEGVRKDEAEAVRWYRMAAEQGNAMAQFFLGSMYARGDGVPQDEAEAERWYRMAAEQGDAGAQFFLGVMYATGDLGVQQNEAEAARWIRTAAEQGNAEAQVALGGMYAHGGMGVQQNEAEAARWIRTAAEQGLRRSSG